MSIKMSQITNNYLTFGKIIGSISLVLMASNTANAQVEPIISQDLDDRCARVAGVEGGTYVFKEPNVYSEQLGTIAEGKYVELEGAPIDDYFPVSIPLQGYIHKDFLTDCYTAKPPENCLQVASAEGIPIYKEPTEESEAVGIVESGRNLRVEDTFNNDWVTVLAPLPGYAPKAQLNTCPPARFES